jgi:DNA-binding NtrC family response regulator
MQQQKKIFILDDDPEILELLQYILGSQYTLFTKADTDGLEKDVLEFQPDLIMIDHFIGEITSNEIITKSLSTIRHIPVILHSAHEEIEKISIGAKVAGFIRKPASIHEIRKSIAKVLQEGPNASRLQTG